MGAAGMLFREIRFIIDDDFTQCYVLLQETGDAPIGVQGWHHRTFAKHTSVVDILNMFAEHHPVMWPLEAPPA